MTQPMALRHLLLSLLLGVAACQGGQAQVDSGKSSDVPTEDDNGDRDEPGLLGQCVIAADCVLAASNCCDCPSFAVSAGDGYQGACEDVECPDAGLCPAVEAICDEAQQCVMICSPIITDKICEFGFSRDSLGCLLDECVVAPETDSADQCVRDEDCTRVALDCCGCTQGGEDGAVPVAEAPALTLGLECQSSPQCPGIDVCEPEEVPRCVMNACVLAPAADQSPIPSEEVTCGTLELPSCGVGQNCVLNDISAKDASTLGVGICRAE